MRQRKNQFGLTLIEVLATVTILSIVTVLIYGVFSTGLHQYSQAKEDVLIQQEANYLLTILKERHENDDSYTITVDESHQKVTINTNKSSDTLIIESEKYTYQIVDTENPSNDTNTISIDPSKDNFHVQIIVTSKKNPSVTYEIKTILSRL